MQQHLDLRLPADFVWFGIRDRPVIEVGWHEEKAIRIIRDGHTNPGVVGSGARQGN